MNKNIIITLLIALLIVISAVQAIQLTSLKAKIDAGAVKIAGTKTTTTTGSGTSSGNSVTDLPSMVGGC